MKRLKPHTIIIAVLIVLLVGAGVWYASRTAEDAVAYQTAPVTRGDLRITISATGTLEPEEVVDVGAQVAGQILAFGQDVNGRTVDYGSQVAQGTVLARIDDSLYAADAASAQAQVQAAQAGVQRAEADRQQYAAKLDQAARDWQRAQKLGPSEALARTSYDAYRSTYEIALANVAVGLAAVAQAAADLAQARAELTRAQRNLGYCTITSPVNGVIIDRRVNIGQTVVASLNAPSLFLIAKDLTRMQVWVAVNEADIGKIQPGLPVAFTVDAFPGQTFQGTVGKIRLNAAMTQNVVTYTVEIITDNKDGQLLPYLTANVQFELQQRKDVLLVPNAALRWKPDEARIAPQYRELGPAESRSADAGGNRKSSIRSAEGGVMRRLWVLDGAYVRPINVRVGLSDGRMTEVAGDELRQGLAVVTGLEVQSNDTGDARNPFAPQFPGRSRTSGSR